MHMYVGVCLRELGPGSWEAWAPDLPAARAAAATSGEALARVRLALEGAIAERLGRGAELPQPRSLQQLESDENSAGQLYEVHINLLQLRALAKHQQGRWEAAG